jgi:hypothetical protein
MIAFLRSVSTLLVARVWCLSLINLAVGKEKNEETIKLNYE